MNETTAADRILARISSESVREATGRDWDEWLETLDGAGAADWDHKAIVAWLAREHAGSTTGWWRQSIAVGYEQARGKRAVGETADAGFQVGVQRTVDTTVAEAWELLTSRPELWLGDGAEVAFAAGERYEAPGRGRRDPRRQARRPPAPDLAARGLAGAGHAAADGLRAAAREDRRQRPPREAAGRRGPGGDARTLARDARAARRRKPRRPAMRKLVESTFVTLDGVIDSPQEWSPPYWDEEHAAYASKLLFAADALLLGRATYEGFAEAWPQRSGDAYTDRINEMPKHVASRTLTRGHLERDDHRGRRRRGSRARSRSSPATTCSSSAPASSTARCSRTACSTSSTSGSSPSSREAASG